MIDLNNEEGKETLTPIEEAKEVVDEEIDEPTNEVIEENKEVEAKEVKEEVKEGTPKPVRAQDKLVRCPKCNREMKLKSFRYGHEQKCQGTIENKPVKPHTNPRPKQTPKPKPKAVPKPPPDVYYSESDDDDTPPQKPLMKNNKKQATQQPINPTTALFTALFQHYQFLQNQMVQQKQERYNNLCLNMFSRKSKKR